MLSSRLCGLAYALGGIASVVRHIFRSGLCIICFVRGSVRLHDELLYDLLTGKSFFFLLLSFLAGLNLSPSFPQTYRHGMYVDTHN
jgi:hypothetical protein